MTPKDYQKMRRERAERHAQEEKAALRHVQNTEVWWESLENQVFLPGKLGEDAEKAAAFAGDPRNSDREIGQ